MFNDGSLSALKYHGKMPVEGRGCRMGRRESAGMREKRKDEGMLVTIRQSMCNVENLVNMERYVLKNTSHTSYRDQM